MTPEERLRASLASHGACWLKPRDIEWALGVVQAARDALSVFPREAGGEVMPQWNYSPCGGEDIWEVISAMEKVATFLAEPVSGQFNGTELTVLPGEKDWDSYQRWREKRVRREKLEGR